MTTTKPLLLPHEQRARLLTGLTVSLVLPLSTMPAPHTIPDLPRRMLFAFSRVAATQLTVTDGITTPNSPTATTTTTHCHISSPPTNPTEDTTARTVTLPTDACTPAALEYLVFWMKQSCSARTPAPITPLPSWRQTLLVHAAARALGAADAERQLYRHVMQAIRDAPFTLGRFRALVDASGAKGSSPSSLLVREAVRRSAGFARQGQMEEAETVRAWMARDRPELLEMWEEFDRRAWEGRRLNTAWIGQTIVREIERLEREVREKGEARERRDREEKRRRIEQKIRDVEEKLQRQRRLAGLVE